MLLDPLVRFSFQIKNGMSSFSSFSIIAIQKT
jgi:hypothetical protein